MSKGVTVSNPDAKMYIETIICKHKDIMTWAEQWKNSLKNRLSGGADPDYFYIGQIQELKKQPNHVLCFQRFILSASVPILLLNK